MDLRIGLGVALVPASLAIKSALVGLDLYRIIAGLQIREILDATKEIRLVPNAGRLDNPAYGLAEKLGCWPYCRLCMSITMS